MSWMYSGSNFAYGELSCSSHAIDSASRHEDGPYENVSQADSQSQMLKLKCRTRLESDMSQRYRQY